MGTGASKAPEIGVQVNPRVEYAGTLAKQEGTTEKKIDAPVLVKLEHGTVRYRYHKDNNLSKHRKVKEGRVERPHEGPERSKKHGYFFHSTLNDFSEDAAYDKEQEWKFRYVYKGSNMSRQKKVFYVSGKGLNMNDQGILHEPESRPKGIGYTWPSVFKVHGHVYFDLVFIKQDVELEDTDNEEADVTDAADISVKPNNTELQLNANDRLEKLCRRMSVRLLKPPAHIHIFLDGKELRDDQVIGDLRSDMDGQWKRFKVFLQPK